MLEKDHVPDVMVGRLKRTVDMSCGPCFLSTRRTTMPITFWVGTVEDKAQHCEDNTLCTFPP